MDSDCRNLIPVLYKLSHNKVLQLAVFYDFNPFSAKRRFRKLNSSFVELKRRVILPKPSNKKRKVRFLVLHLAFSFLFLLFVSLTYDKLFLNQAFVGFDSYKVSTGLIFADV